MSANFKANQKSRSNHNLNVKNAANQNKEFMKTFFSKFEAQDQKFDKMLLLFEKFAGEKDSQASCTKKSLRSKNLSLQSSKASKPKRKEKKYSTDTNLSEEPPIPKSVHYKVASPYKVGSKVETVYSNELL